MKKNWIILSLITAFISLNSSAQNKLFTLIKPSESGLNFNNIVQDGKLLNVISYEYFYNGGATCIGDINNDGLQDIFFSANVFECKLFLNQGNLKFKDITNTAKVTGEYGYHTGAAMVDINNDGWLDIYVCRSVLKDDKLRKNVLYINNHDGTFTDRAEEFGLADIGYATQAYFNDLDGDGDIDAYILNHPYNLNDAKTYRLVYNKKNELEAFKYPPEPVETCRYFENNNGKFIDKTKEAGLMTKSFALSAVLEDFNGDGKVDIYQCNDYLEPDYLFINQGNGSFKNQHEKYFKHGSYSAMGSDYADLNNDGLSDLITVDMLPENPQRQKQLRRSNNYDEFEAITKYGFGYQYAKNVVQLNNGNGSYSDVSYLTNLAYSDWSWGTAIADFDNDGNKDVYIANGYMRDITDMDIVKFKIDSIRKIVNQMVKDEDILLALAQIPSVKVKDFYFKNYGDLKFNKESKESGIEENSWSYSVAYADLDNDGDLELIVNNCNEEPFLYKNNTIEKSGGNYLRVELIGPANNMKGLGTKLILTTPDGIQQTLTANPFKGYLSSRENTLHFGCNKNTIANLKIIWADGKEQVLNKVNVNQVLKVNYSDALTAQNSETIKAKYFEDQTKTTKIAYKYIENAHIDFKLEPLLPHRLSQMGPCLAVGDINGDRLEDFLIGGAKDHAATAFLQQTDGTFLEKKSVAFALDKKYEDGAILLTDLDLDGDLDAIMATGGNEYTTDKKMYPIRFYKNDGKGNFTNIITPIIIYTSAHHLSKTDIDKDGIPEYFVGGRSIPGHFGLVPSSMIFRYVKGDLQMVPTSQTLKKMGMVTTATWVDLDKNGYEDLVVAGQWMPLSVFYNNGGKLADMPTILNQNSYGWWNHIVVDDIDNDGDLDILAGNLGRNTRYNGTEKQPMTMAVNDFDRNGSTDCIISTYVKDKSYPIAIRDYVLDQMPILRKKYLRYAQYSTATLDDMFTDEQKLGMEMYTANNMNSGVFINDNSTFSFREFPIQAQIFPVNAIAVEDVNKDGIKDVILSGNNYSTEVETGRDDAGIGLVLEGTGNGNFKPLSIVESGFFTPNDVKSMAKIKIQNKTAFLIGNNSSELQVIKMLK